MNKAIKRNKAKVWRSTYGKPFILRRALSMIRATVIASSSAQQVSEVASHFGGVGKALAVADMVIKSQEEIAACLSNHGFAVKTKPS